MGRKPKSTAAKLDESPGERSARVALQPSVNSAAVIQSYSGKMLGSEPDMNFLIEGLLHSSATVNDGDLSHLEAMLVSQATGLQSIFASLARQAQAQTSQRNLEAFLGLALKAQNQSRATIATLVDLKFPRQVAFVKQTNVSTGPQQINNHSVPGTGSRTEKNQPQRGKLLVRKDDGSTYLDTGATKTAGGSHPTLEAVESIDRPDQSRRQSEGVTERLPRGRVAKDP